MGLEPRSTAIDGSGLESADVLGIVAHFAEFPFRSRDLGEKARSYHPKLASVKNDVPKTLSVVDTSDEFKKSVLRETQNLIPPTTNCGVQRSLRTAAV